MSFSGAMGTDSVEYCHMVWQCGNFPKFSRLGRIERRIKGALKGAALRALTNKGTSQQLGSTNMLTPNGHSPVLTKQELVELEAHVEAISFQPLTPQGVGASLKDIHDRRLFREFNATFEGFCSEIPLPKGEGLKLVREYEKLTLQCAPEGVSGRDGVTIGSKEGERPAYARK
jgi:hypothetical protein